MLDDALSTKVVEGHWSKRKRPSGSSNFLIRLFSGWEFGVSWVFFVLDKTCNRCYINNKSHIRSGEPKRRYVMKKGAAGKI